MCWVADDASHKIEGEKEKRKKKERETHRANSKDVANNTFQRHVVVSAGIRPGPTVLGWFTHSYQLHAAVFPKLQHTDKRTNKVRKT